MYKAYVTSIKLFWIKNKEINQEKTVTHLIKKVLDAISCFIKYES